MVLQVMRRIRENWVIVLAVVALGYAAAVVAMNVFGARVV